MRFIRTQFGRFVVAGLICIALSATWLGAAWWELRGCSLLRQIRHQLTYTLIHFTALPFAVGWLAAHITREFCFPEKCFKKWRLSGLGFLYLMMVSVFYVEITAGHILTYQLEEACRYVDGGDLAGRNIGDTWRANEREAVLDAEARLKEAREGRLPENEINARAQELKKLRSAYEDDGNPYLQHRQRSGLRGTIEKGNVIVRVAMFLTLGFQLSAATAVWCIFLHWLNTRGLSADHERVRSQIRWLTTVILSFAPWCLARAYANHFEEEVGMVPTSSASVVFALVVITMFLSLLQLDLLLRKPEWFDKAKIVGFACLAAFSIVLVKIPAAAGLINDAHSALHAVMVIVLCILTIAGLACIGWIHLDRSVSPPPREMWLP